MGNANFLPSPLWGRGWLASGVLISRGGPGEGVETVSSPPSDRKTRSLARTTGQIDKARELRRSSTEAEQAAWHLLRKLRLKGFWFRPQHPVGPYIADFCCRERRLIVELDGSVHGQPSQANRDAQRDAYLKALGNTVLRVSHGKVFEAPELFVEKVVAMGWSLPEALG
ncbi:MAG: endonuclease domain-containing protein [Terriglobia bacterium]